MQSRPKIKLELTTTDKIFEITGWIAVLTIWILTVTNYSALPETIPTHYNAAGRADGFGGKGTILTLPLIATILLIELTILNKFPHIFNYPTTITSENALRQYTNATRLIRYLKLIVVVIFGFIAFKATQSATENSEGPGVWFLPLTLSMIFIPLLYFVINSFRAKQ